MKHDTEQSANRKPKMTKAERREKYTRLARERKVDKALRRKGQHLFCFRCRVRGHVAQHCPDAVESPDNRTSRSSTKCCYKCGSRDHPLSRCPQRNEAPTDLPFATCFVCKQKGHLASQCSINEKGIYVNGTGACKSCGSKYHLSKDCPVRIQEAKAKEEDSGDFQPGLEETTSREESNVSPPTQKPRVVKF